MLALSMLIIATSFYLSLSGAKVLSDKSNRIQENTTLTINNTIANINKLFDNKVSQANKQIDFYNNMIINGTHSRLLRSQFNQSIDKLNTRILDIEKERDEVINKAKNEIKNIAFNSIQASNKNVQAFIILSTFIESIILIGVAFSVYYTNRIFVEFEASIAGSPKLKRYMLYNQLLDFTFRDGKIKEGDFLLNTLALQKLAKTKDIILTTKSISNFFALLKHLGVINQIAPTKRIPIVNLSEAKLLLKEYYNN